MAMIESYLSTKLKLNRTRISAIFTPSQAQVISQIKSDFFLQAEKSNLSTEEVFPRNDKTEPQANLDEHLLFAISPITSLHTNCPSSRRRMSEFVSKKLYLPSVQFRDKYLGKLKSKKFLIGHYIKFNDTDTSISTNSRMQIKVENEQINLASEKLIGSSFLGSPKVKKIVLSRVLLGKSPLKVKLERAQQANQIELNSLRICKAKSKTQKSIIISLKENEKTLNQLNKHKNTELIRNTNEIAHIRTNNLKANPVIRKQNNQRKPEPLASFRVDLINTNIVQSNSKHKANINKNLSNTNFVDKNSFISSYNEYRIKNMDNNKPKPNKISELKLNGIRKSMLINKTMIMLPNGKVRLIDKFEKEIELKRHGQKQTINITKVDSSDNCLL